MDGFCFHKPIPQLHMSCQNGIPLVFHGLKLNSWLWAVFILSPPGDAK
jgi:hypothetical protein